MDAIVRRRLERQRRQTLTLALLGGGGLLAVLVVVGVVLAVTLARPAAVRSPLSEPTVAAPAQTAAAPVPVPPSPPVSTRSALLGVSPDREGLTWSPDELAAYLIRSGVKVRVKGGNPGLLGPPSVWLVPLGEEPRNVSMSPAMVVSNYDATASVEAFKFATAQDAKDRAGVWTGAWAWGRYYFRPTPSGGPTLEAIRKSLGG